MKKKFDFGAASLAACSLAAAVACGVSGCSGNNANNAGAAAESSAESGSGSSSGSTAASIAETENAAGTEASAESTAQAATGVSEETAADGSITVTAELGEGRTKSLTYDVMELDAIPDMAAAIKVELGNEIKVSSTDEGSAAAGSGSGDAAAYSDLVKTDGGKVTLKAGGVYVLSGVLDEGQIIIEGDEEKKTCVVLDGVSISSSESAPIYAPDKGDVHIILTEGSENVINDKRVAEADGEAETASGAAAEAKAGNETKAGAETKADDAPEAAILVKSSLSIAGGGSLTVNADFGDAIRSKSVLKIVSGDYKINAADAGIKGKDGVMIRDGSFAITSVGNAVKSSNEEDADCGYVWIENGSFVIDSQKKGFSAENELVIMGGSIDIKASTESFEGKTVDILGGTARAVASDDGINAAAPAEDERAKMADQEGVYVRIAGGELYINAAADGVDSNGDFYMEGGTLYLSGPEDDRNGILDYNGTAVLTGGNMVAAGAAGMTQDFGDGTVGDALQNYIVVYYDNYMEAGTKVSLLAGDGSEMITYAPEKKFEAVIITCEGIEIGETYTVVTGDESLELEISGVRTVSGEARGFGGGQGGFVGVREGFGGERGEG
ncbi:MAG: carbohydrate-binding domain-containing protein, partial [Eubacteriales bacterium]|nr:carbohydrate-binding domain-containing protein [Eubacteriales bacterium]